MRVGSGGATLNALLVAAEHLSARAGFTVSAPKLPPLWSLSLLVPESFQDSWLFWLHCPWLVGHLVCGLESVG
jgi:hypothetical protein